MSLTEEIEKTIKSAIPGSQVHVSDPFQDGQHLEAHVIAEQFIGLSLVKQQQLVMSALKEHFSSSLHALQLTTAPPINQP